MFILSFCLTMQNCIDLSCIQNLNKKKIIHFGITFALVGPLCDKKAVQNQRTVNTLPAVCTYACVCVCEVNSRPMLTFPIGAQNVSVLNIVVQLMLDNLKHTHTNTHTHRSALFSVLCGGCGVMARWVVNSQC